MSLHPNFYRGRVCLNVLAKDIENAKEIVEVTEGHVVIGVLSKNYATVEEAIEGMNAYAVEIDNAVSIGLGSGDPNQWKMVAEICKKFKPQHVNQVFTGVGYTRALVSNDETFINGLVSPTGQIGCVNIATGPISSQQESATVPIETAIAMLKDMGGNSIKYFPMRGLETKEEYQAVAKVCAAEDFYLEPTGGLDLANFAEILEIPLRAGVKKVIPHVYSSIINKATGKTKIEDVQKLYKTIKRLVDQYA
ncbi:2-dehydro-3-deoxy-phosphogluconate aldolase [Thermoflavimicrobium daqui]|uniref:2-dehydro-3-deoxyphosphooctonate aldolase n=1 Tax=Thermoflavimicrobium daqui TaxID=2137476 RepID=A0A364K422_9BACL|nr:KDGP aldolase family protein [Thermoflavimicrobium daqui]RAL24138.1 2-dehydro-3-deoxyphosphooctonate aldolase [Thermoflavimicrobium daqui]